MKGRPGGSHQGVASRGGWRTIDEETLQYDEEFFYGPTAEVQLLLGMPPPQNPALGEGVPRVPGLYEGHDDHA